MASVNFRPNRSLKRSQNTLLLIALCVLLATVTILLLNNTMEGERARRAIAPPSPQFDASRCLRLMDFSRVYAIIGDPANRDVVWFCGAEGLRRLDISSIEWQRFGLEHGLPSEEVTCAVFEPGRLLVGTGAGLACLDSGSTRFRAISSTPSGQEGRILAVESMPGQRIYFSIENRGLFRLTSGDTISAVPVPGLDSGASVTCLKRLRDGRLFVGMDGSAIAAYDPAKNSFAPCRFERPVSGTTQILDVIELPNAVYIGTSNDGIWTAPTLKDTLRQLVSNPAKGAYAFASDSDGFWCGTPFGLWRYYQTTDTWVQFVNPEERESTDFQVFALLNTPRRIWYGTRDLGAGYFDKELGGWQRMRAGLSKPNVAAVAASDSEVWTGYGYQGNGLDRFREKDLAFVRNYGAAAGIGDAMVQSLLFVKNRLYYGGYNGFGWFDAGTGTNRWFDHDAGLPSGDIAGLIADRTGHLLLASADGVIAYDPARQSFDLVEQTRLRRITALLPIGDSLWYGTLGQGLYLLDRRTGSTAARLLANASRIVSIDTAMFGDTNGLFVVTKEQGAFGVDRQGGRSWPIDVPPALVPGGFAENDNNIMSARRIGNRVWLGTRQAGCLVYDIASGAWVGFGPVDGLVSRQVRSFADSEKYIWIGCFGGLNRIDKSYIDSVLARKTHPAP